MDLGEEKMKRNGGGQLMDRSVASKRPAAKHAFVTPIQIRLSDIDFFGHVHATRFMEMVFTARREEVKARFGKAVAMLEKEHLGWVVAGVEIRYLRQLRLDDTAEVHTWTIDLRKKECDVGFLVVKNGAKHTAEGVIHFTLVKWPSGWAVALPELIRAQYLADGMFTENEN